MSYQVTYKSVSLIICVALRISLRRHALAHRFLHAAAVKQKLGTNTEEGKKMRSSHTWLPPYPSFPNSAPIVRLLQKMEEALLFGSSFWIGAWEWLGTESFLKSPKLTL